MNNGQCGQCVPDDQKVDEILESIWTCREKGDSAISSVLESAHVPVDRGALEQMEQDGLVTLTGESVSLTSSGEDKASTIIRRHRLAERLVVDVLGLTIEDSEHIACLLEHGVVPEVTDSLCTLLGHPTECPHGKPIPSGADCVKHATEVARALMPLSEIPCGSSARVAYIRTGDHQRLHQLLSMGFSPGVTLRVHQRTPVIVVQIEQSEFALDKDVAGDIHVWLATD